MITIKLSFLLAINLKKKEVLITKKSSKLKGVKHGKSKSSSKSGKKAKKKKSHHHVVREEEPNGIYSAIEARNPISYVHIDYNLFGKSFHYAVDVVCWEAAAKIYTKNGTKCLKTVTRGDIVWVPVFIEHYLNPLTTEEIRKLLSQVILLHIKTGNDKVGAKAKSDHTSTFYLYNEDADDEFFPEVFTQKPNEKNSIVIQQMERILKKVMTFPVKREMVTWIYDMVQAYKIANIINQRASGEEIHCKDFVEDEEAHHHKKGAKHVKSSKSVSKKSSKMSKTRSKTSSSKKISKSGSKKSKKSKKSRSRGSSHKMGEAHKTEFRIPGHVLLSDPVLATYQVQNSASKLEEVYVLVSSDNMLTSAQKLQLHPLVVKIRKIDNLPADVLNVHGFRHIYITCTIPGITEFSTSLRPIANTLHFDESRFIITTDFPRVQISELLRTRRVVTKIFGVHEKAAETHATHKKHKKKSRTRLKAKKSRSKSTSSMRSEKHKKKSKTRLKAKKSRSRSTSSMRSASSSSSVKSTHGRIAKAECLALAAATFELSSLVKTFFLFREKGQCCNLQSLPLERRFLDEYFIDRTTVNEINLNVLQKHKNDSPLSDPKLFDDGTTVKFEAHFLTPTNFHIRLSETKKVYKRLLLVIFDMDVAEDLLTDISAFNGQFIGLERHKQGFIPNFYPRKATSSMGGIVDSDKILSGFFIDDGNSCILFVEGHCNGHILTLLHQVSGFNYATAKVFYNSDYLFEERLYPSLYHYTGVFITTLKLPFVDIIAQEKVYLEGNVPFHCLKAIQKLNLILNSGNFKTILNHDLLPAEVELVSFALEYGLHILYKSEFIQREDSWSTHGSGTVLYKLK